MKYSITIPTYKAQYLERCIDSILSQTYSDFELIIVNDASPEDIDSIVIKFSDPRIRYYKNQINCGSLNVVDNWNKCLSYAVGDYIICIGDDDELSIDCLEQYNILMGQYPDLDVYHGRVIVIDEHSEFVKLQEVRPPYESVYSMVWYRINGRIQYIGDFLFRREALLRSGGFYKLPLAWGSDDVTAFIAAKSKGIANTEKPIFYYRAHRESISRSANNRYKVEAIESEYQWCKELIEGEQPVDEVDRLYVAMLEKTIEKQFYKKKRACIVCDLRGNPFGVFHWLTSSDRYKLSRRKILHSLLLSFFK